MLKQVSTFFRSPIFPDDEDKTRKARYANAIAMLFLAVIILYETVVRFLLHYAGFSLIDLILLGIAAIFGIGLVLLRKGFVRFTSILLVVIIWVASNSIAASGYGVKDASYLLNCWAGKPLSLLLSLVSFQGGDWRLRKRMD